MSTYSAAMTDLAHQAYRAGLYGPAEAVLRLIVGQGLRDAHVVYFIGHLCHLQGRMDDARDFLTLALELDPDNGNAHNDLGETLRAMGRNQDAVAHFERAISLQPHLAYPYGNLAATLIALGRHAEALRWAGRSLAQAADKAVAHCDMGSVLGRLGRPQEAITQYARALALRPGDPRATYFQALMRLTLGDLPTAWDAHEARLRLPNGVAGRRLYPQPWWRGEDDITGRRILLHAEQGLGDTIHFVRYAPMVAARGAIVSVEVQPGLRNLLRGMPGIAAIHEVGEPIPPFELQCSLMSLPAAFRTSLADIPATVPYVHPAPDRSAVWQKRLGPWQRMRVGIAWSGRDSHPDDRFRSIPLTRLGWLAERSDIECHVIQREVRDPDRTAMAKLPGLADHSALLTDFGETAALLAQLDLIISVDTAVVHLAGAMGKPTWLLLAHSADWRWMTGRLDSPWYPTLRLFRQTARDDWGPVLADMGRQLDLWSVRHA